MRGQVPQVYQRRSQQERPSLVFEGKTQRRHSEVKHRYTKKDKKVAKKSKAPKNSKKIVSKQKAARKVPKVDYLQPPVVAEIVTLGFEAQAAEPETLADRADEAHE